MQASSGTSSSPGSTITWRSGIAKPGDGSSTRSKGVRSMLPSVLQPNATDHVPVLAEEVRRLLDVQPGETVVDATFGAGGHATLLAEDLKGEGKYVAIDRDPNVKPYFESFRRRAGVKTRFLAGDFADVLERFADNGRGADAILFDLGVSSMQLDRPERGFSYAADAPLDMRMDPSADVSARELVNEASERELAEIFRGYGEERYARQIAKAIGRERRKKPFATTRELVETLKPGGRIAVISFHSLEDRIVKRFFRNESHGCTCPPDFPVCVCGREPTLRVLTRKAVRPTAREIASNPRAASARLRAAVKV